MEILVWLHILIRLFPMRGYAVFNYQREKKNNHFVLALQGVFVCKLMQLAAVFLKERPLKLCSWGTVASVVKSTCSVGREHFSDDYRNLSISSKMLH